MKNFFFALFLFFSIFRLSAQTHGIAFNLGYSYINTNTGYIGGEYAYRFDPENWHGIAIGVGTHYGSFNNNFKFIPEAHLTYSNTLLLGEFSITQHNINPSIGINGMNIIRLKMGYSWKIGNENLGMKGITFGINFLMGSSGFYDRFDMKF